MRARTIILFLSVGTLVMLTSCWSQKLDYPRTFEFVWAKVNETCFDTTFGGLNWRGVHDRCLPQITAAANDDQFYRLVNKMLWELKVSHANLVPPGLLALREPLVCAEAGPGIDVRVLTRDMLLKGIDSQLEAAVGYLGKKM